MRLKIGDINVFDSTFTDFFIFGMFFTFLTFFFIFFERLLHCNKRSKNMKKKVDVLLIRVSFFIK